MHHIVAIQFPNAIVGETVSLCVFVPQQAESYSFRPSNISFLRVPRQHSDGMAVGQRCEDLVVEAESIFCSVVSQFNIIAIVQSFDEIRVVIASSH